VWDDEVPGLGIRVSRTGRRAFFVFYGPTNKRRRFTIGPWGKVTLDGARKKARDILAKWQLGEETVPRSKRVTFGEHAARWLEHVERRKKAPESDRRYMRIAVDRWGTFLLSEIRQDHIREAMKAIASGTRDRHEEKVKSLRERVAANGNATAQVAQLARLDARDHVGHTQANRFLASVRACFADAVTAGDLERNPAAGIKQYRENPPRARVVSSEEMARLLDAIAAETDPHIRAAFRLLIETGARRSEVLRARWEDFDLVEGLWRIPSPKAGHPQVVPLSRQAVAMLSTTARLGEWLVPGRDPGTHRYDLVGPWLRLVKKASLEGVTVHDIRRTFGLEVARTAGLHVASKLLRHADVRVTERVYAPLGIEDLRKATEAVQRPAPDNVVEIKKRGTGGGGS
jgi:integrase